MVYDGLKYAISKLPLTLIQGCLTGASLCIWTMSDTTKRGFWSGGHNTPDRDQCFRNVRVGAFLRRHPLQRGAKILYATTLRMVSRRQFSHRRGLTFVAAANGSN